MKKSIAGRIPGVYSTAARQRYIILSILYNNIADKNMPGSGRITVSYPPASGIN